MTEKKLLGTFELIIEKKVRIRRENICDSWDPIEGHLESSGGYRENQFLFLLKRLIEEKLSEQFSTPVKIVNFDYDLEYDDDTYFSIYMIISTGNRTAYLAAPTVEDEITNAYYDYWDSSTGELNFEGKQKLFDYVSKEDPAFVIEEAMETKKHLGREKALLQTQIDCLSNLIRKLSRFDWGIELSPECLKE